MLRVCTTHKESKLYDDFNTLTKPRNLLFIYLFIYFWQWINLRIFLILLFNIFLKTKEFEKENENIFKAFINKKTRSTLSDEPRAFVFN